MSEGPILRRRKRTTAEQELDAETPAETTAANSLSTRDKVAQAAPATKISTATMPILSINTPLRLK